MQLCPIPIPFPSIGTTLLSTDPSLTNATITSKTGLQWLPSGPEATSRGAATPCVAIERLHRRITQALNEPLDRNDDTNAHAAIADLRRIRKTIGTLITEYAKHHEGSRQGPRAVDFRPSMSATSKARASGQKA